MGLVGILGYRFPVLNGATATPTSKIIYSRDTYTVCISIYRRVSLISYKLLLIININFGYIFVISVFKY